MSDIFISYKKEEKEVAAKLAHALERDGWTVWWDVEIPTGADFETLIKETLGTCDVTIVLWSKESIHSDWVRAEAEYARKYKKVFPVLIEELPHQDLPLLFQKLHAHDLTNWSGERNTPGYKDLYKNLVNLLGEPKSPEVRALEERLEKAQHELEKQKQHTQSARQELEQKKQDTQKARQELEEQMQQRSSEADIFKDELNEAQHELEKQKQDLQQRTPSTFGIILPWVVTASIVVLGGLYLAVRAPSSGTQELQAEVAKWQAQAEEATKRVSELDTVNRELTATLNATEGNVNQLEDTVAKWQKRAEEAEGQNQKDRQTIEALAKELEQIHEHIKREAKQKAKAERKAKEEEQIRQQEAERLADEERKMQEGLGGILPEMVRVGDFYIGKYEMTQGEWKAIMGNNPSRFDKGDEYPVEQVSFNDVQKFIRRLNEKTGKRYRLPTEEEWYRACHEGGAEQEYCGGDDIEKLAWYAGNSDGSTHPVGRKRANGLGIHDMSGNVWEWTSSPYESSARRVIRGGAWEGRPVDLRSALRGWNTPDFRDVYIGFRLAQDL